VSLVDIAPTVLRAAGIPDAFATSGTALQGDHGEPRARPVLAMADGYPTIENYRRRLNGALLERLRHSYGVAYDGTMKAIVGVQEGDLRTFRLANGDEPSPEIEFEDPAASEFVAGSAREVADELRRAAEGDVDSTVEDRLRSWGYL